MDKYVNESEKDIYTKHLLFEKWFYTRETIKAIGISPLAEIHIPFIMIGWDD